MLSGLYELLLPGVDYKHGETNAMLAVVRRVRR